MSEAPARAPALAAVADHILAMAFGPHPPEAVARRVPDLPVPGPAG